MKEAALAYVDKGIAIFPLEPYGKRPITPNGFKDATRSRDVVEEWWTRWPEANIGMPVPKGVVIVDVDGEEGWGVLKSQDLALPASASARTPRGEHHWYAAPPGVEIAPKVGVLPSIDVRAWGSYVVAPPSNGPAGRKYEWIHSLEEGMADCPDWLVAMASHKAMVNDRVDPEAVLAGISEGMRDATLFRYACKLRGQGVSRKEADILVQHAASVCTPPFPPDLADKKLEQAWKYEGPEAKKEPIKIWTLNELAATKFEEPRWVIKDILPEGVTLMVSGPKMGKSLLSSLASLCAAGGVPFLGFDSVKCQTLYLDLEDPAKFAQDRWATIWNKGRFPKGCHTAFSWDRMDEGGLDSVRRTLDEKPEISLVVIDVLTLFWPIELDQGSGNAYTKEYRVMKKLANLAEDFGICLMLLHHDSKAQGKDRLSGVSGTRAITGAAHTIWQLDRDYGSNEGTLDITGKHVRERSIPLMFNPDTLRWGLR